MNKKILIILILIIFILVPLSNTIKATSINRYESSFINKEKVESYSNKNLVALGDSIATGYLLEDAEKDSYVSKLAESLNMNKINLSVDGRTSTELIDSFKVDFDKIKSADVITLSIGGNDIMMPLLNFIENKASEGSDLSTETDSYNVLKDIIMGVYDKEIDILLQENTKIFEENYILLISELRNINSEAEIVVQTVYNPFRGNFLFKNPYNLLEPYIKRINDYIINERINYNYLLADIHKETLDTYSSNIINLDKYDIHPNKKGHNMMFLLNYKLLAEGFPYSIKSELNNISMTAEYSKESLSPVINLTAMEGYILPTKVTVINEYGQKRSVKVSSSDSINGTLSIPKDELYSNLLISGTGILKEELNNNNSSETQIIEDNNIIKKDENLENTELINSNKNESKKSKSYNTGDTKTILLLVATTTMFFAVFIKLKKKKSKVNGGGIK